MHALRTHVSGCMRLGRPDACASYSRVCGGGGGEHGRSHRRLEDDQPLDGVRVALEGAYELAVARDAVERAWEMRGRCIGSQMHALSTRRARCRLERAVKHAVVIDGLGAGAHLSGGEG